MATQLELLPKKLKKLGFNSYIDYLKSDHWIDLRFRFYSDSKRVKKMRKKYGGIVCEFCFSPDKINLHHKTYKRIGAERLDDLVILCENCHHDIHKYYYNNMKIRNLWRATKKMRKIKFKYMVELARAVGIVQG